MLIIGCDFHTRFQQIAMAEDSTGELLLERRLDHERRGPRVLPQFIGNRTRGIEDFLDFQLSTANLSLQRRVALPSQLYPFVFLYLQNRSNKTYQPAKY